MLSLAWASLTVETLLTSMLLYKITSSELLCLTELNLLLCFLSHGAALIGVGVSVSSDPACHGGTPDLHYELHTLYCITFSRQFLNVPAPPPLITGGQHWMTGTAVINC